MTFPFDYNDNDTTHPQTIIQTQMNNMHFDYISDSYFHFIFLHFSQTKIFKRLVRELFYSINGSMVHSGKHDTKHSYINQTKPPLLWKQRPQKGIDGHKRCLESGTSEPIDLKVIMIAICWKTLWIQRLVQNMLFATHIYVCIHVENNTYVTYKNIHTQQTVLYRNQISERTGCLTWAFNYL